LEKDFERCSLKIAQTFLKAVSAGDSKKVMEMAKAMEFLKKRDASDADPYRKRILMLREIATTKGAKWPIRLLAKIIGWHHVKTDDGLSQLRRICKELNFPITPEKIFKSHLQGK